MNDRPVFWIDRERGQNVKKGAVLLDFIVWTRQDPWDNVREEVRAVIMCEGHFFTVRLEELEGV